MSPPKAAPRDHSRPPPETPAEDLTERPDRTTGARRGLTPEDPRLGAWRSFLEAHARLARRLDEELRASHGITLAEYDALLQLARSPGRRLRMHELADRVILSRSGISRLVDRLEADRLVVRTACSTDGRGAEAVLTEAGLARLREAAKTHLAGIERYFLEVVPPGDLAVIERALGAVARRACPGAFEPVAAPEVAATCEPTPGSEMASELEAAAEAAPTPAAPALERPTCTTVRRSAPRC